MPRAASASTPERQQPHRSDTTLTALTPESSGRRRSSARLRNKTTTAAVSTVDLTLIDDDDERRRLLLAADPDQLNPQERYELEDILQSDRDRGVPPAHGRLHTLRSTPSPSDDEDDMPPPRYTPLHPVRRAISPSPSPSPSAKAQQKQKRRSSSTKKQHEDYASQGEQAENAPRPRRLKRNLRSKAIRLSDISGGGLRPTIDLDSFDFSPFIDNTPESEPSEASQDHIEGFYYGDQDLRRSSSSAKSQRAHETQLDSQFIQASHHSTTPVTSHYIRPIAAILDPDHKQHWMEEDMFLADSSGEVESHASEFGLDDIIGPHSVEWPPSQLPLSPPMSPQQSYRDLQKAPTHAYRATMAIIPEEDSTEEVDTPLGEDPDEMHTDRPRFTQILKESAIGLVAIVAIYFALRFNDM
ncbi:hypothetical protein BX600DRAFT_473275 [Xylariales sp. PMI_506]|nr:hypothetical protein BX600DRAFT_473275 [Xylariales sp. PMI_506]